MNFIKEIFKDKIKPGFTIIEILIVIAMISTIVSIQVTVILKYMKVSKEEIYFSRDNFYVNEAFAIIKSEIDKAKYINISNNMIALKRHDNGEWDYIKLSVNSNIVLAYGGPGFKTTNNVLKNVSEFTVLKRYNMCFLTIKTKRGNVYRKCFGISAERVKEDS
ncbi:type II secretion system protein [Clostridium sp. cel8]|uniref:prepilin-type N-terminal cleavage/methylation domain-containing protein n=1 Tax=unclassified Clostridium TaxID=2614128 RepID=UPI0015F4618C|nr:type II secretion system protein [Clostridium sp. cel8]